MTGRMFDAGGCEFLVAAVAEGAAGNSRCVAAAVGLLVPEKTILKVVVPIMAIQPSARHFLIRPLPLSLQSIDSSAGVAGDVVFL